MSETFGNDYVVLTDEDGNEVEFEHIDTVEVDGNLYMAFIPAELAVDEEAEVVILRVDDEDGEEILVSSMTTTRPTASSRSLWSASRTCTTTPASNPPSPSFPGRPPCNV